MTDANDQFELDIGPKDRALDEGAEESEQIYPEDDFFSEVEAEADERDFEAEPQSYDPRVVDLATKNGWSADSGDDPYDYLSASNEENDGKADLAKKLLDLDERIRWQTEQVDKLNGRDAAATESYYNEKMLQAKTAEDVKTLMEEREEALNDLKPQGRKNQAQDTSPPHPEVVKFVDDFPWVTNPKTEQEKKAAQLVASYDQEIGSYKYTPEEHMDLVRHKAVQLMANPSKGQPSKFGQRRAPPVSAGSRVSAGSKRGITMADLTQEAQSVAQQWIKDGTFESGDDFISSINSLPPEDRKQYLTGGRA